MEADAIWLIVSVYVVVGSVVLSAKFPASLTRTGVVLTALAWTWAASTCSRPRRTSPA